MNTKNTDNRTTAWQLFQKIGVVVAVLASLATLIAVYFQVRLEKRRVEIRIQSIDYLTNTTAVPDLVSDYRYKGDAVKNLWLMRLSFRNTGDVTLIGSGRSSYLIQDRIEIIFPEGLQIIGDMELLESSFPHNLKLSDSSSISLSFDQWKTEEFSTYSIYLKSDDSINSIIPYLGTRSLIDGDIEVIDNRLKVSTEKKPIIDYLKSPIPQIGRFIGVLVIGLLLTVFNFAMLWDGIVWFRFLIWRSKYLEGLKELVNSQDFVKTAFNDMDSKTKFLNTRKEFIHKPRKFPQEVWDAFNGKRVPVKDISISSWKNFFKYLLLVSISNLVLVPILLSVILR